MRYLGGKARLAKHIIHIITEHRQEMQYFVEPFCGACNITWQVSGNRIANDNHYHLIEMWKAVQSGWTPPMYIDKLLYNHIKQYQDRYPAYLVGFVGFAGSFGAKWFGGYASGENRNFINEGKNSISRKVSNLYDVQFENVSYQDLAIPDNSIIYCDPPYQNTTGYKTSKGFNHDEFWQWCRDKTTDGHKVYISEFNAPDDFTCIWEKERKITSTTSKYNTKTERLFIYEQ